MLNIYVIKLAKKLCSEPVHIKRKKRKENRDAIFEIQIYIKVYQGKHGIYYGTFNT